MSFSLSCNTLWKPSLVFALILPWCFSQAHADAALQQWLQVDPSSAALSSEDLAVLQALAQANHSPSRKLSAKPLVTAPGEVRFIYGASEPTVVCSLMHICDIALEPNEQLLDIKAGDAARWIIDHSQSGSPEGVIEHITVKPTDIGLRSNLRLYTDRRTYHLNLQSDAKRFMPSIAFSYPEQALAHFHSVKAHLKQQQESRELHIGPQRFDLTQLNFNYRLEGDAALKPLRVFNDGTKTYLQMAPEQSAAGQLPALVAVTEARSYFGADKTAMLNYRFLNNCFVIDSLPQHLRLISGSDDTYTQYDIYYTK